MNLLKVSVDVIGIILELYFSTMFFDCIFGKATKKNIIIFSILYTIILCVGVFVPQLKMFAPAISLFSTFILSLAFNSKLISKMIYSTILFLGFLMSEMVIGLLLSAIFGLAVENVINNLYFYACGVLFSKFVVYIMIRFIIEIKNKNVNTSLMSRIAKIIILPIATLYTVLVIFFLSYTTDSYIVTILTVVAVLLLILANIFTINFIDKILNSEMKMQRLAFIEKQLEMQANHYKEIMSKQREISRIKHDMNNYLITLSGYIISGDTQTALLKIGGKVQAIAEQNYFKCDNYCMETLINTKYKDIIRNKIGFKFKTDIPEKSEIDETDLCIITGNILDNAIEACTKISSCQNKTIELNILTKGEYISIYQTNPVSAKYLPKKDLSTIKDDTSCHGFGIDNIKQIVKKYDGISNFEYKNEKFQVCIMLKNG